MSTICTIPCSSADVESDAVLFRYNSLETAGLFLGSSCDASDACPSILNIQNRNTKKSRTQGRAKSEKSFPVLKGEDLEDKTQQTSPRSEVETNSRSSFASANTYNAFRDRSDSFSSLFKSDGPQFVSNSREICVSWKNEQLEKLDTYEPPSLLAKLSSFSSLLDFTFLPSFDNLASFFVSNDNHSSHVTVETKPNAITANVRQTQHQKRKRSMQDAPEVSDDPPLRKRASSDSPTSSSSKPSKVSSKQSKASSKQSATKAFIKEVVPTKTGSRKRRKNEWTHEQVVLLLTVTKALVDYELKAISAALFEVIKRDPGKCHGRAAEKKLKRLAIFDNWKTCDRNTVIEKIDLELEKLRPKYTLTTEQQEEINNVITNIIQTHTKISRNFSSIPQAQTQQQKVSNLSVKVELSEVSENQKDIDDTDVTAGLLLRLSESPMKQQVQQSKNEHFEKTQ